MSFMRLNRTRVENVMRKKKFSILIELSLIQLGKIFEFQEKYFMQLR